MAKEDSPHKFYERLTGCEVEISNLKGEVQELKDDFKDFKDNHFKTFKDKVEEFQKCFYKKMNQRPTWLMAGIFALCSALIVYLLTR